MISSDYIFAPVIPNHDLDQVSGVGDTRIWIGDLDNLTVSPSETACLSPSERVRGARPKDEKEGLRFLAGRVFTRKVLAAVARVPPNKVDIVVEKCGRPGFVQSSKDGSPCGPHLEFSVSHSENVLCIAIGQDCEIGVDIEVVRPGIDVLSVSKTSLDLEDLAVIERSSVEDRLLTFYKLWTKREAFAKMQGHGICSSHVRPMPAESWQYQILDFRVGEKRVVGSLAVCFPA